MIISWKNKEKPKQTNLALGFKITHNDKTETMWIPKSLIKNNLKPEGTMADIPDWLYEQKMKELF